MTSRDQPAMRTILAGLVLVLLFYAAATTIVTQLAGWVIGMIYVVSLPISADVDLQFTDRIRQARDRMRAYFRFRRNPGLRERLCAEHAWLVSEIAEIARMLEPQVV
jgi:hypothetical protein